MTDKMFTVQALTKIYTSGEVQVVALRGLDLEVFAGEIVVLLGPSGSGKSTLLNIMGGLDHATSGHLFFKDIELTGLDDRGLTAYRRRHVGFVFQFYNLVPSLTARENVALVTEIAERPMRPEEALALVGLENRMSHFPAQLSGGEQQRVAIARAIAKRPEVLLCDEPTGALDSKTGIRVIEALLNANSQLGTTTLIITHNASIQEVADRVMFFADGQISRVRRNEARQPRRAELVTHVGPRHQIASRPEAAVGTGAAIALVIAGGVATLVLAVGSYRLSTIPDCLLRAPPVRRRLCRGDAPKTLVDRLAEIPGVAAGRCADREAALLDIPNFREPATGQFISLPEIGEPALNRLYLRVGRMPEPGRAEEVMVSESLPRPTGSHPGPASPRY